MECGRAATSRRHRVLPSEKIDQGVIVSALSGERERKTARAAAGAIITTIPLWMGPLCLEDTHAPLLLFLSFHSSRFFEENFSFALGADIFFLIYANFTPFRVRNSKLM